MGFQVLQTWLWILALSLPCCVTWGPLPSLNLRSPIVKWGKFAFILRLWWSLVMMYANLCTCHVKCHHPGVCPSLLELVCLWEFLKESCLPAWTRGKASWLWHRSGIVMSMEGPWSRWVRAKLQHCNTLRCQGLPLPSGCGFRESPELDLRRTIGHPITSAYVGSQIFKTALISWFNAFLSALPGITCWAVEPWLISLPASPELPPDHSSLCPLLSGPLTYLSPSVWLSHNWMYIEVFLLFHFLHSISTLGIFLSSLPAHFAQGPHPDFFPSPVHTVLLGGESNYVHVSHWQAAIPLVLWQLCSWLLF